MMYVPEFVALYEIFPYIEYLPLDDESIRVAVKDYLEGGETRNAIIKKYGCSKFQSRHFQLGYFKSD